jgi:DNA-binding transcriptional MerR regulator
MVEKSPEAFRNISEVSTMLDVPAHVLRFWETRFNQIKPVKRSGGRRYYRPEDIQLLTRIRDLLYREGYTIKGAQQVLKTGSSDDIASDENPVADTVVDMSKALSLLQEASHRLARLEQA